MPIGLCSIRLVHSTGEIESVFQVLRFDWLLAGLDVRAPIAVERLVPDVLLELRLRKSQTLMMVPFVAHITTYHVGAIDYFVSLAFSLLLCLIVERLEAANTPLFR